MPGLLTERTAHPQRWREANYMLDTRAGVDGGDKHLRRFPSGGSTNSDEGVAPAIAQPLPVLE